MNFADIAKVMPNLSTARNVYGGTSRKDYILETTGNGVAIFDYDGDGKNDIFIANGTRLHPKAPPKTVLPRSTAIWETADSENVGAASRVSPRPAGRKAYASEITITTAAPTFLSPLTGTIRSIAIAATERSKT